MKSRKTGVAVVAAILIGAAIFAFVAYTAFDAIGFGKVVTNEKHAAPAVPANNTITLAFSAESVSEITTWTGAAGDTFNTSMLAANWSWNGGNSITINYLIGVDPVGYGHDTTYFGVNYTGAGSAARAITMPVIILVAVFAIIVVTTVMVGATKSLSGGKGNKKQW